MLWVLLALALPFGAQSANAQQREVTGTVTGPNGEGIGGAAVSVLGTNRGVRTDAQGRFAIPVGVGEARLRVAALTYRAREVTVPAGQSSVAVRLETDALGLETVVVTGQATAVRRENLAHDVAVINNRMLVGNAPAQTLDRALQGKVAGATIRTNSGAPGGGVQIRLRGATTLTGNSTPLYVVDGVIVSDVGIPGGQNAISRAASAIGTNSSNQDAVVNRIADLNPNDIENVEILKGASAASIYGSRAAAGVVVITTRRGRAGAPRYSFSQRVGYAEISNTIGVRPFTAAEAEDAGLVSTAASCAVSNRCTSTYFNADGSPKGTFDLERQVFGRKAPQSETSLSVSGGSESTQYYASGLIQNDQGIAANTGYLKQAMNLSLNQTLGRRARISASTNVVHSVAARGVTGNDNTSASYVSAISFTPSFFSYQPTNGVYPRNPFSDSNPLETSEMSKNNEDVWRVIGSVNLNVDLMNRGAHALRFVGTAGADYFNQNNRLYFPPNIQLQPFGPTPTDPGTPGTSVSGGGNNLNVNTNLNLVHSFKPETSNFSATTSAGVQFEDRDLNLTQVTGRFLMGSLNLPYNSAVQAVSGSRQRTRDAGGYIQEELLLFNEMLSLTGSVRGDRSSNNADVDQMYYYPKAAAAFTLPNSFSIVDQLKFRAAYGASGNEPLYGQKYTPLSVANIEGRPNLAITGSIGADDLRPERVTELEGGFDATLFDSRAQLTFTMYRRNITDLLLTRSLAQSTGYLSETFNGGVMRSVGQEVSLQATLLQRGMFAWNTNTTFTRNRTKITELPVPEFSAGNSFGNSFGSYRVREGFSPTTVFANNGRDAAGALIVAPIGESEPSFQMGFQNDVKVGRFTLGSLFDWSSGGLVVNLTRNYFDEAHTSPDFLAPASLARDAAGNLTESRDFAKCGTTCLSGEERLYLFASPRNVPVYVEDASFVKLRELALSYDVPTRLLGRRVSSAQLQLSSRNVATWTDYSGYDPEVSNFGNVSAGRNQDVTPFPPSRTFWLGLNLVF
ncbi:MAG TPA: SusC/RagA family TonB-linked outer membrane protein [Longimicrobium sp.]|nr:SusC/RagA family TonB-linked outer membrane protein [Longimicrobium sp.]